MKKALIALCIIMGVAVATPAVEAGASPKVDCTVLVFKPSFFWQRGYWSPAHMPHGWTVDDWFDYCSGRFRPKKKSPDRPDGSWGTTIRLNTRNCTYQADVSWMKDPNGWRKAKIYISPWRA